MVDIYSWHPWFAWHPVRVAFGKTTKWVWFATVLRRLIPNHHYTYDEYDVAHPRDVWEYLL